MYLIVFAGLIAAFASAAETNSRPYQHHECDLVQSAFLQWNEIEKEVPPLRLEVHPVSMTRENECVEQYRRKLLVCILTLYYR